MILNKKYVIGLHLMFYEIEMFHEYVDSLVNMLKTIDNKDNVIIDVCLNTQEYLEKIDTNLITENKINSIVDEQLMKFIHCGVSHQNLVINKKTKNDPIYFHTDYRRDLNYKYCTEVDYVIWGESDSLIPKEALQAIETLSNYTDKFEEYNYIMTFADRKLWDDSWDPTVHRKFINHIFIDDENGHLNPNQAKSCMSIKEMDKINSEINEFEFTSIPYTKIDGSFLVISSDLIKSGVNIPKCMLYNDDEGFAVSYNQLHPNKIKQYIAKNILKVHARRHPKKRMYVKDENNSHSFNDQKGNGFKIFKEMSEKNLIILRGNPGKFFTYEHLKQKL